MATTEEKLLLRLEADARKLINETKKANDNFRDQMRKMDADFQAGNQRTVNGMANKVRAMREGEKGVRNYGTAIQNTAFQIGDFAVQVAGGTSATRAAAQQLPQLLGGLGVFGAVAGAAAAVLIPLAGNLFAAEDAMASQTEAVKALAEAMSSLRSAGEAAGADPADLISRFGAGGAEQAKEILEIERRMAEVRAQAALTDVTKSIGGMGVETSDMSKPIAELEALRTEYDALYAQIQNFREVRTAADQDELDSLIMRRGEVDKLIDQQLNGMASYRLAMTEFADQLGLTFDGNEEAIQRVNDAMIELGKAKTPEQMATAGRNLSNALLEASDSGRDLSDEGRQLLEHLTQSQLSALELAQINIASGIWEGVDAAAALKGELAAAANAWLAARSLEQQHSSEMKYASRGTTDSRPVTLGDGTVYRPPSTRGSGRGGGGGGAKSSDDWLTAQADRAQAALDMAKAQAESVGMGAEAAARAEAKFALLAEAKRRNLDLDAKSAKSGMTLRDEIDRQADSIAALTVQADRYQERAQFMTSLNKKLEDGFLDAIVSGKGFSGVLQDIAQQLAKAALQATLFGSGPFASASGGGGGGGGGLFGGLLSGIMSYDGGGWTGNGVRAGGLDGKGGQLTMTHPREQVIDTTKPGGGQGGGAITLNLRTDSSVIAEIASNTSGMQIKTAMSQVPSIIAEHEKRKS